MSTSQNDVWALSDRDVKAQYNDAVYKELGTNRILGDATTWGNVITQRSNERLGRLTTVLVCLTGVIALGTAWVIIRDVLKIFDVFD